MVQWTNLLQTTGLCYGWQAPLLCLKLDPAGRQSIRSADEKVVVLEIFKIR